MKVNLQKIIDLASRICEIDSRTFQEKELCNFFKKRLLQIPENKNHSFEIIEHKNCLYTHWQSKEKNTKTIALIGHLDVVSPYFKPYLEEGKKEKLHGSGISDMKNSLAIYLYLLENYLTDILKKNNLVVIFYAREEGTSVQENGLYDLIKKIPTKIKAIDLAIVGEPTDNTLQFGCVGSLHAEIKITGKACHSARPWQGENALYNAIPFLQKISSLKRKHHSIFDLDFYDVLQVTESSSETGRTSLPGIWKANVNFRFAPIYNEQEAKKKLIEQLIEFGIKKKNIFIKDISPSGKIVDSPLLQEFIQKIGLPKKAKQAWTDVAQLGALEIPCLNFGAGLTSQAHVEDEYIFTEDMKFHTEKLLLFLI